MSQWFPPSLTTNKESFREKVNRIGKDIFPKIVTILITTIVISFISFGEFWYNDAFHVIVLTNLLQKLISRNVTKKFFSKS